MDVQTYLTFTHCSPTCRHSLRNHNTLEQAAHADVNAAVNMQRIVFCTTGPLRFLIHLIYLSHVPTPVSPAELRHIFNWLDFVTDCLLLLLNNNVYDLQS